MRVIDVEAGAIGKNQVGQARLFLGGALLLLHVLEAPRVAERALRLVVPPDPGRPECLVGVDQQQRGQDRVEVRLVLDRDPVLGFDAHDFRDGHASPVASEQKPMAGGQGRYEGGPRRPPSDLGYMYWPVLTTFS